MTDNSLFDESGISYCLAEQYGLDVSNINPLTGGADQNASVFRVVAQEDQYFLKVRIGDSNAIPLLVQQFLDTQGIDAVLAPLATKGDKPWASAGKYTLVLYPFIEGNSNAEAPMSGGNWEEFGKVMKRIHETNLSQALQSQIRTDSFSSQYPDAMISLLKKINGQNYSDPITSKTAEYLLKNQKEIIALVEKTNKYKEIVLTKQLPYVLCHSDIHAGNRVVSNSGKLMIIDLDEPIQAPIERDLMFIGGGIITLDTPQEIEMFYQGYGQAQVSGVAIAYFRCRRVLEDIVLFSEDILDGKTDSADNETRYGYLTSNFLPGGPLDIANQTEI